MLDAVEIDVSAGVDGEEHDIELALAAVLDDIQNRRMLDRRGEQSGTFVEVRGPQRGRDDEVVGLGGSAGEQQRFGRRTDERSDLFACCADCGADAFAGGVDAGGVAKPGVERIEHRLPDFGKRLRGGVVIEIDLAGRHCVGDPSICAGQSVADRGGATCAAMIGREPYASLAMRRRRIPVRDHENGIWGDRQRVRQEPNPVASMSPGLKMLIVGSRKSGKSC